MERNGLENGGMMLQVDVLLADLVACLRKVLMRRDTCCDSDADQNLTTTT